MKYYFLIIFIGLVSCGQSVRKGNQFYIEHHSVPTKYEFSNCFKWESGYLCLTKDNSFVYFDRNFVRSEVVMDSSKKVDYDFIYCLNDSIFCTKFDSTISKSYYLDSRFNWHLLLASHNWVFYEDNDFLVSECCAGEWGGSIFFIDKKSNLTFSAPATCPVALNKINGNYYLTSSLAHKSGYTEVIRIKDPRKLFLLPERLKANCNWWTEFVNYENGFKDIVKYEIGTEKIIDTSDITTIATFQNENCIYTLSNLGDKTFVGKIDNNQLLEIDSVMNGLHLRSHNSNTKRTKNGFLTFFDIEEFQDFYKKANGFIELESDTFKIIEFKQNDKSP